MDQLSNTGAAPLAAPRATAATLIAYLKANGRSRGNWYLYEVIVGDRVLVSDSKNPEHDLARALLAEGITGTVEIRDAKSGAPRALVNIEKAAKMAVQENTRGFRTVKWAPFSDQAAVRKGVL
jgi:hypothetical protein